ncbi:MAG: hypothetical protein AB1585_02100 [Thermodesulfobacteriota bacterium]
MTEDILEEINLGLSEAEKSDLEAMISEFKDKPSPPLPSGDLKGLEEQIGSLGEKLSHFAAILLKNDNKIKLLLEILRLSDQKSRIMNQRIDALMELLKGKNIGIDV